MSDVATQAALNQIFDRLGNIDGRMSGIEDRLDAGSKRHDEFSTELKEINAALPPLKTAVEGMQPIVADYQRSRNIAVGVLLAVGSISAILGSFAVEIKKAVLRALGVG